MDTHSCCSLLFFMLSNSPEQKRWLELVQTKVTQQCLGTSYNAQLGIN